MSLLDGDYHKTVVIGTKPWVPMRTYCNHLFFSQPLLETLPPVPPAEDITDLSSKAKNDSMKIGLPKGDRIGLNAFPLEYDKVP